ncbi:MAG: hypothetical protein JWN25_2671 [Verrucomicrobiales bacterium]|nr:hypothetical protein [Verrucomicrobiales bacterium]
MILGEVAYDGRWHPGIGDPTVIGWVTAILYFVAFFFCWKRVLFFYRSGEKINKKELFYWFFCSAAMFLLGVNKQLDLQTYFTEVGRDLAKEEGWYEKRRMVQVAFIFGMMVVGLVMLGFFYFLGRNSLRQNFISFTGLIFLGCFVVIRAASFHYVDQLLGHSWKGLKVNWILELGGISLVLLGALPGWHRWRPGSFSTRRFASKRV